MEETGQKNTVLTLYELMEGEATISQGLSFCFLLFINLAPPLKSRRSVCSYRSNTLEFHGMDPDVLAKSLNVLVKRGKAQVFGSEDSQGVKFF